MMTSLDFTKRKAKGEKISMVTAYDAWSAKLVSKTNIDCILVGDSLAMVIHGHPTTLAATVEMMVTHVEAVARSSQNKFIVADMPFMSFRKGPNAALEAAEKLMRAGAHSVKLEGVWGHEDVVSRLVQSGIPVMGHIGLTPQSIHQLGGFKVQGKTQTTGDDLKLQALKLEELGCFAVVVECVPSQLTHEMSLSMTIPTFGIGAGSQADGQVLGLHDLLGLSDAFAPKFLRQYAQGFSVFSEALEHFDSDVKATLFPSEKESYLL